MTNKGKRKTSSLKLRVSSAIILFSPLSLFLFSLSLKLGTTFSKLEIFSTTPSENSYKQMSAKTESFYTPEFVLFNGQDRFSAFERDLFGEYVKTLFW